MIFSQFESLCDACNAIQDAKDAGKFTNEADYLSILSAAHDWFNPRIVFRMPKMIDASWNPLQAKEDGTLVIPDHVKVRRMPSSGASRLKKPSDRLQPLEIRFFAITRDGETIEKVFKPSDCYNPFAYNRHPGDDPMYMATIKGREIIAQGGEAWIQKRIGEGDSKGNKSILTFSVKDHIVMNPQQVHEVGVKFNKLLTKKTSNIKVEDAPQGIRTEYSLKDADMSKFIGLSILWEPNLILREYILERHPECQVVETVKEIPADCILYSGSIPNLNDIQHIAGLVLYAVRWQVSELYSKSIDCAGNFNFSKRYDRNTRKYVGLNKDNLYMIQPPVGFVVISTKTEGFLWKNSKTGDDIEYTLVDKSDNENKEFLIKTQDNEYHLVEREPLPNLLGEKGEDGKAPVLLSGMRRRAEQLALEFQTGPKGCINVLSVTYQEISEDPEKEGPSITIGRSDLIPMLPDEDKGSIISRWTVEQPLPFEEWEALGSKEEAEKRKQRTRRELGKKKEMFVVNKHTSTNSKWVGRARNSKHGATYDRAQRAQAWTAYIRS
jgi:hypothetical protein